ncbi:MAG: family 20 glycosylhydrolase [Roseibacillus sp.]
MMDLTEEVMEFRQVVLSVDPEFQEVCFSVLVPAVKSLSRGDQSFFITEGECSQMTFSQGEVGEGLSYRIVIGKKGVDVTAEDVAGAAQAAATLLQLAKFEDNTIAWPEGIIGDGPDQRFRCFMVDMGRNPHSPKMLRDVIDTMWFYKVNYLQLHLTDDQLFSWPSKAFPKLYSEQAGWTWQDFEELEAYSQARGVTIIPELDVPGHSTILRKYYPKVFGETTTELASLPEAQKGVETLISELLSVFKSTPYYHMGGDEAYGVPEEIQRDFINRLNVFIKSKGKQTLVWEGPHLGEGENKVAEDVVHMIWRCNEVLAQQALDAGYQVVNASWDPLYIVDHYPRTMFTAVDVKRCYQFDLQRFAHINHEFATYNTPHLTKSKAGMLGFCMPWWEGREQNLLPLCVPRLAAVAAAAWNREGESDFAGYQGRQERLLPRLQKIAGFVLPETPVATPESQGKNLAYLAKVTSSDSASQPHFGPERLTNGIPDRFDHFLGYPTVPEPLEILIELKKPASISRIQIFERAQGQSWEEYEVLVSGDGEEFISVGSTKKETRGEASFVNHSFEPREVRVIKIVTSGCQELTFPSFSRLSEVMAFAE